MNVPDGMMLCDAILRFFDYTLKSGNIQNSEPVNAFIDQNTELGL